VSFAGPTLIVGASLALAAALAGWANGVAHISQSLEMVSPDGTLAAALDGAWLALMIMGGAMIALFVALAWFIAFRVHHPLRVLLRSASNANSNHPIPGTGRQDVIGALALAIERQRWHPPPPLPDGTTLNAPPRYAIHTANEALKAIVESATQSVHELKEASGRITAMSRDVSTRLGAALKDTSRASESFCAAIEQTRNDTAQSVRSLSQSTEAFVGFGEDAANRIGGICTRIATGAELLAKAGERVVDQIAGTFQTLEATGTEIKTIAIAARENGDELARVTNAVKPELVGTIETLRAASLLFERHVDLTRGRLAELIETASRGEHSLAQHWGAALVSLAEGSIEVQRKAAHLTETALTTTNGFAVAAEDFRKAGQILVKEAGAVRSELAAGNNDMRATKATLTEMVQMLTADGGIRLPTPIDLDGHVQDAELDDDSPAPAVRDFADFMTASDEVLRLARMIERLDTRTTQFAKRLVQDVEAQPDIDREELEDTVDENTDTRADETIAALLGSIERINSIAASISQAGDAASRRIQPRGMR
jgi:HAMP domain-containing protein/ABC-type transporter Mla subunit MlaD